MWLKSELAYYDSAVHRFNHYTRRTLPENYDWSECKQRSHTITIANTIGGVCDLFADFYFFFLEHIHKIGSLLYNVLTKLADCSLRWPEGSFFNSYYIEVKGRA